MTKRVFSKFIGLCLIPFLIVVTLCELNTVYAVKIYAYSYIECRTQGSFGTSTASVYSFSRGGGGSFVNLSKSNTAKIGLENWYGSSNARMTIKKGVWPNNSSYIGTMTISSSRAVQPGSDTSADYYASVRMSGRTVTGINDLSTRASTYGHVVPNNVTSATIGNAAGGQHTYWESNITFNRITFNYDSIINFMNYNISPDPDGGGPGPGGGGPGPGGGGPGPGGGDPDPGPEPDPGPDPPYIPPDPPYIPPEPPPDPTIIDIDLTASGGSKTVNYKTTASIDVPISFTAYDRTSYGDGSLKEFRLTATAGNKSGSDYSYTEHDTLNVSLTPKFTLSSSYLSPYGNTLYTKSGKFFKTFDVSASANIEVQGYDISGQDKVTLLDKEINRIYVTNNAPSISWSLRTHNMNGGTVPNGYYYVGEKTHMIIKFTDPENDPYAESFGLSFKSNNLGITGTFLVYNYTTNGQYSYGLTPGIEDLVKVENIKCTASGLEADITFYVPGTYSYIASMSDAGQYPYAGFSILDNDAGSFVVRSEPAPPTAIINSPVYAYEQEPFRVQQSSTDPNGVDDIISYVWTKPIDVTEVVDPDEAAEEDFEVITNATGSYNGKNGGTLTFPVGSAHHTFRISLKVTDATNLADTAYQDIQVISNVPIPVIPDPPEPVEPDPPEPDPDLDIDGDGEPDTIYRAWKLKENRRITLSAADSLAPNSYPIMWDKATWEVYYSDPELEGHMFEDTTQRNGNKQRVYQFDKPGVYYVKLHLTNGFLEENLDHEDAPASTVFVRITVIPDEIPNVDVSVISEDPNFDIGISHTVKFQAKATSPDSDIIQTGAGGSYEWVIYEDTNSDGIFTENEIVPQSRITYNTEYTEAYVQTSFDKGRHNTFKAYVKATEKFGQPTLTQFLAKDGSWKRFDEADIIEVVNWVPDIEIIPDQPASNPDDPNYDPDNPGTPYEPVDIDGDGQTDGTYIRAYTDDTFSVHTNIMDEFPELVVVDWKLEKKDHSGVFNEIDGATPWIDSQKVTHTLGHDGGTVNISEIGIYKLTATATDDLGYTNKFSVLIRVYMIPIGVLESNPVYQYYGIWTTKENIRFDLRSDPTIVDDEWGVAWHKMNWSKDCWEITPLEGQSIDEIHVMKPDYSGSYADNDPNNRNSYLITNSQLGGISGNSANGNEPYRSISFTEPGRYSITYWGTNYGGKVSEKVEYIIDVIEDEAPEIYATINPKYYRSPDDGNRATIGIFGPYSNLLRKDVLTVSSIDGDFIKEVTLNVIYDSNNNKSFEDASDLKWITSEFNAAGVTDNVNKVSLKLTRLDPYS